MARRRLTAAWLLAHPEIRMAKRLVRYTNMLLEVITDDDFEPASRKDAIEEVQRLMMAIDDDGTRPVDAFLAAVADASDLVTFNGRPIDGAVEFAVETLHVAIGPADAMKIERADLRRLIELWPNRAAGAKAGGHLGKWRTAEKAISETSFAQDAESIAKRFAPSRQKKRNKSH